MNIEALGALKAQRGRMIDIFTGKRKDFGFQRTRGEAEGMRDGARIKLTQSGASGLKGRFRRNTCRQRRVASVKGKYWLNLSIITTGGIP